MLDADGFERGGALTLGIELRTHAIEFGLHRLALRLLGGERVLEFGDARRALCVDLLELGDLGVVRLALLDALGVARCPVGALGARRGKRLLKRGDVDALRGELGLKRRDALAVSLQRSAAVGELRLQRGDVGLLQRDLGLELFALRERGGQLVDVCVELDFELLAASFARLELLVELVRRAILYTAFLRKLRKRARNNTATQPKANM